MKIINRRNYTYPNCELYFSFLSALKNENVLRLCFLLKWLFEYLWKREKDDRWNVHTLLKSWYRIFSNVGASSWYEHFKRHILILILTYEKKWVLYIYKPLHILTMQLHIIVMFEDELQRRKNNSIWSTLVVKHIYCPKQPLN